MCRSMHEVSAELFKKGSLNETARIASLGFKGSGDTWFYHFAKIPTCMNPQEWSHRLHCE